MGKKLKDKQSNKPKIQDTRANQYFPKEDGMILFSSGYCSVKSKKKLLLPNMNEYGNL